MPLLPQIAFGDEGDNFDRFQVDPKGRLAWGAGDDPPDVMLGRTAPRVLETTGMFFARRGVATRVLQRPPTNDDLDLVAEGVSVIDAANRRVYFKLGNEWRYAPLV